MARDRTRFTDSDNQKLYWATGSGEKILIVDMALSHLINAIRMLERRAEGKRKDGLFDKGKNLPTEVMFPIIRYLKEEYNRRMKMQRPPVGDEQRLPKLPVSPSDGGRRHRDVELD